MPIIVYSNQDEMGPIVSQLEVFVILWATFQPLKYILIEIINMMKIVFLLAWSRLIQS